MQIDKTAIVKPGAKIAQGVEIGPYSIVEGSVEIKSGSKIMSHCHIKGRTVIGENNLIHSGCIIGEKPQMLGLRKEIGQLTIGSGNIIREYATIHTSTKEDCATIIGDNNYLMGFVHIAHDCRLNNNITMSNGSLLAGHVEIEDSATISASAAIHQFVRIGRLAMIGGLSRVSRDVPPFMLLIGNSKIWGINSVGLKRAKIDSNSINVIKKSYNILYRERLTLNKSLEKLNKIDSQYVEEIILFIRKSKRGISGPHRSNIIEKIFLDYPLLCKHSLLSRQNRGTAKI